VALLRRPLIDLQLRPFKVVDVMEIPGLRPFLRKLLTCDIPAEKRSLRPAVVQVRDIPRDGSQRCST